MPNYYAGFDTAFFPTDPTVMQSLWDNTNLRWCGFYMHKPFGWRGNFAKLKAMGWGLLPIYTGKQPVTSTALLAIARAHKGRPAALQNALYQDGMADGNVAAAQAKIDKMPPATCLYFDVEQASPDLNWYHFYRGWSRAVVNNFYSVGLYTRPNHAGWIQAQLMNQTGFDICFPEVWIAKYNHGNPNGAIVPKKDFLETPYDTPNPKLSWAGASSWQHTGNYGFKWEEPGTAQKPKQRHFAPVDFNSSIYPDPGLGILSLI